MTKLISSIALLLLLNGSPTNALQGVKTKRPPTQRSAVAVKPIQYYADSTVLPSIVSVDDFPSITFIPEQQAEQVEQPKERSLTTELLSEGLGTAWIVGIGSLASMAATFNDPFTSTPLPEIALVWSLAVTTAIYACRDWGDAHFNPAMTVANALFRDFSWNKVLPYSLAQTVGSAFGSAAAFSVFHTAIRDYEDHQAIVRSTSTETARVFGEYFDTSVLTTGQAFGVEALGTAILAATAFGMTHSSHTKALPVPVVMGGTVFSLINWLAPFTQCGMNPARDFGPRLVAYTAGWTDVAFQDCWVYIAAPLVGAAVGAALMDKIVMPTAQNEPQQ